MKDEGKMENRKWKIEGGRSHRAGNRFSILDSRFSVKKGQVAVILILVVAAALIFYAVSLNLGRVSQTKVITTVAADTGASLLASYMASFGQSLWMTSLGGEPDGEVCGLTGIVASIVVIILLIAYIACVIFTVGVCAPAGAAFWPFVAALVALTLAVTALGLQVAVIQPGLSGAWNDIIWHAMEHRDAFVEQGIQTALSAAAADNVQVPDLNDSDGDRVWGLDGNGEPLDEINRFGFYYGEQRIKTIPLPASADIQDFFNDLENFMTDRGDGWGLYDDTGPVCATSECNPCCVLPSAAWTEEMGCGDPTNAADVANMRAICEAGSPYGDGVSSNYPWVYDAYRGNPTNAFVAFQEQLGRDDEHKGFEKREADPNGLQDPVASPLMPPNDFQMEDTTAYHAADDRIGVFGFFYKIADWGMDLDSNKLVTDAPLNPECNWCDERNGTTCDAGIAHPTQLVLPLDPTDPTLVYNKTYCVDGINLPNPPYDPGNPPLAVDLVRLPDPADFSIVWASGIGKIVAQDDQCAQNARGDPNIGFWKRGGDLFCSAGGDAWPYYMECSKYNYDAEGKGSECVASPENWPDDLLDDVNYGLNLFMDWARDILSKSKDPAGLALLAREFRSWYPDAVQWIEPGRSTDPLVGSSATSDPLSCTSCCYLCNPEDGALHVWWKEIQEMKTRLEAWRDTSFAGSQCREVWCVPPADYSSCAPGWFPPPASEEATFDSNGNGIRGDIEDVVACLDYNIDGPSGTPGQGNDYRFAQCRQKCDAANCSDLPRSLLPYFDPTLYVPPLNAANQADIYAMLNCLDNCSAANCQAMPQVQTGGSCVQYFTNAPATSFDETTACFGRQYLTNDPATFDDTMECGARYFTFHPSTFDETASCSGRQYFASSPATFDETTECGAGWGPGNIWYNGIDAALALVPAIPAADATLLTTCQTSCSNTNCQAMPQYENIWGPGNIWYDEIAAALLLPPPPADATLLTTCRDNCSNINCQAMPQFELWRSGNTWYDEINTALALAPPIPAGEATLLTACQASCTNADCQAMPQYENIWGPGVIWYDEIAAALPTGIAGDDAALINCRDSCGNAACQAMPQFATGSCGVNDQYFATNPATSFTAADCAAWGPGNTWYDDIVAALIMANPWCDLNDVGDPAKNGWLKNVELSKLEAQNQVAKFRQRRDFLSGRLADLDNLIQVLTDAENKFDEFLSCPDGPVCKLIKARMDLDNQETGLPYHAIYGWQSEPEKGQPPDSGKWHIVRVDARIPEKCDRDCNAAQTPGVDGDPGWPRIGTRKVSWGMKKCYFIDGTNGMVKVRVTRFDESPTLATLLFPNAVEIWRPTFDRPDRPVTASSNPRDLATACLNQMEPNPGQPTAFLGSYYYGAFMMNKRIATGVEDNDLCWDLANRLLARGVTSEACARYYFTGAGGMEFKFVPCENF